MSPMSCLVLVIFAAVLVPRGSNSDPVVNVGEDKKDGLEQVCDTFPSEKMEDVFTLFF